jgi:hypothetical protein
MSTSCVITGQVQGRDRRIIDQHFGYSTNRFSAILTTWAKLKSIKV